MKVSRLLLVSAFAVAACNSTADRSDAPSSVTGTSGTSIASPEAAVTQTAALAEFRERVQRYAKLHDQLARGSAELEETEDAAEINDAQAALAAKVREARGSAKHGDIFTPAVRPVFRRLLAPELKGSKGRDTVAVLDDDAPAAGTVPFEVNAAYPDDQPLPTVPVNVLMTLPELPEPLEYRIVGQHLLLLDTAADLVVDYILNAIVK